MPAPLIAAIIRAAGARAAQGELAKRATAAAASKAPYRAAASRGGLTLTEATDGANNAREFRRIIDGAKRGAQQTAAERRKVMHEAAAHTNQMARQRARQVKWAGNERRGDLAKLAEAAAEARRQPAMGSPFNRDWERDREEKQAEWEAKKEKAMEFVKKLPGGKVIAFGLGLALVTKKVKDFGAAAVESKRHLARYDAGQAGAQMGLDRAKLQADIRTAGATSRSTRDLSRAVQALTRETQPLAADFTNFTNRFLTGAAMMATMFSRAVNALRDIVDRIPGVDLGGDAAPATRPMTQQLTQLAGFNGPRNRRPAGEDAP